MYRVYSARNPEFTKTRIALYGFTSQEVFNGAKPDKYFFKPQMEEAKMLRKAENKALSCDSYAFSLEKQQ